MNQAQHDEEIRQFERMLHQLKVDRIPDRMTLLMAFLDEEDHFTAEEWQKRLKKRGVLLEPEFLSDTLEMLTRFGLASLRPFDGGQPRYEHRHLGEHHDHLICKRCGCIEEFHHPGLEALQRQISKEHGFHDLTHRLQIYGLCQKCRAHRLPTMPLPMANVGEVVKVAKLPEKRSMSAHLREMGLIEGAELEIISTGGGPVVVALGGSRLALGRGMANYILVNTTTD